MGFAMHLSESVLGQSPTHAFEDIKDVGTVSKCLLHKGQHEPCVLKRSLLGYYGWSCKNLSKEFSSNKEGLDRKYFFQQGFSEGCGSSGETYEAMKLILQNERPVHVVWENVPDALSDAIFKLIVSDTNAAGYSISATSF